MNDDVPRHPEATVMAAFVEGKLPPDQIAEVAAHLRDCRDCRTVVSETARFEREEETVSRPQWWQFAAIAAVLATIAISVLLVRRREPSPIARLIDTAPTQHRYVEARLSGFRWAQLQAPARGTAPPAVADLKLAGAAGEVLENTKSDHAAGVAYLLIDRRKESIAALEKAAKDSDDAHVWNDLAAARYAFAVQDERPSQLPLALAAADHALRLDPQSPEALFNRALILEHLGILDAARKAWQSYLAAEGDSAWSVEARAHLRALESPASRFDENAPAESMVRQFPEQARRWAEGPLLMNWSEPGKLPRARGIANALAAFNGEKLLGDAVDACERARGRERDALIEGHRLYNEARIALSKREMAIAESKLLRAAQLFREGRSPMEEVALYYAANAIFSQRRGEEALELLRRLRSSIDRDRHRALDAQILWQEALIANSEGDWGAGVRAAEASAAAFHSLGETRNEANVSDTAAHALDMIGAADRAWAYRIRDCAVLANDRNGMGATLRSAATTLQRSGHADGAAAMIDVAIDVLRNDPPQLVAALTERARLANDGDALVTARQALRSVRDGALRATLDGSIDVADASLRIRTEPRHAIATLDRAVAFFSAGNLRTLLPDAYLQRARAYRAAGDDAAAVADYAAAMREVEAQQNTIEDADLRLRFLDTAAQVIEESIELQLARGAVTEAFAIADAARGGRRSTSPGVAVLEYVALPHAIAIFDASREPVTVEQVAIERDVLEQRIASFAEKIRLRAPVQRDAAALYELLMAPVQSRLAGIEEIVVVPDARLQGVPFAALFDAAHGQYLIEQYTLRFALSASAAQEGNGVLEPALLITDPLTDLPRLPASRNEGERIAALYGATAITGEAATRKQFVASAENSALIHYAGHADDHALLLAGDVLSASAIAHLPLKQHPLVVLAACGTFRGETTHVAGMSSLGRAFLLAGARAVVGTLWEVDDDVAATFFYRLHQHLRAGLTPARAVRAAQIEMTHASDERSRHPASWAPVEVLVH